MTAASYLNVTPGTLVKWRHAPQTVCRIKSIVGSNLFRIECEDSAYTAVRADFVKIRDQAQDFITRRKSLPYGKWTTVNGDEFLFNRDYEPIWRRCQGEDVAEPVSADLWVENISSQRWFYDSSNPPWESCEVEARCKAVLREWGVPVPKFPVG